MQKGSRINKNALRHKDGLDYGCDKCKQFISLSFHKNNGKKVHDEHFVWIKPDGAGYLRSQKNKYKACKDKNQYLYYEKIQFDFGKYATTGFVININEMDDVEYKTICPKCGDILGQ